MIYVAKDELENYNFALPKSVAEEFRKIGDVMGERNKLRWAVASAAVLRLLEMPEGEMHALIQRIAGLRMYPKELAGMVEEAKARAAGRDEFDIEQGVLNQPKGSRASAPAKPRKSR